MQQWLPHLHPSQAKAFLHHAFSKSLPSALSWKCLCSLSRLLKNTNSLHHRLPGWDPAGSFLEHLGAIAPDAVKAWGRAPLDLPPRYLQWQRYTDLYWQYKAWMEFYPGEHVASWPTFYREFVGRWHGCLKFRSKEQHAQCSICAKYMNHLHNIGNDIALAKDSGMQVLMWSFDFECDYFQKSYTG